MRLFLSEQDEAFLAAGEKDDPILGGEWICSVLGMLGGTP
jgi:hypothetical protein